MGETGSKWLEKNVHALSVVSDTRARSIIILYNIEYRQGGYTEIFVSILLLRFGSLSVGMVKDVLFLLCCCVAFQPDFAILLCRCRPAVILSYP